MIKGTGQRLIPRKLLEWIKGLHKGEGASLNITTLTDSKGNPRFIEGDCVLNTLLPEGVEISYAKWSLSGTHLMIVVAGTLADTTGFNAIKICDVIIPEYIGEKIYPVFLSKLEYKTATAYAENYTQQQLSISLSKFSNTNLQVVKEGNTTLTADRAFRIQFDLLIDTE